MKYQYIYKCTKTNTVRISDMDGDLLECINYMNLHANENPEVSAQQLLNSEFQVVCQMKAVK